MTPNCKRPKRACQLAPAIDGHLVSRYRINPNLATEEQLILVTDIEVEDSGVFQEELALLGNKNRERRQVELLLIHIRCRKNLCSLSNSKRHSNEFHTSHPVRL